LTQADKKVYSVSELTAEIKELLEYNLDNIHITGEISNFRVPASGHYYFTLKDDSAQIKAVMFRQTNMYMKFIPKDGMQVFGIGRVSVYEPQGTYQVILDYMEPTGIGALKQAFEDLKQKLKDEGLFDEDKKKTLPMLLRTVGVVTSPTGAAIKDFVSVATRRFSNIRIIIYPAKVQGKGAAEEIVKGIEYFNRAKNVDAIVITRGGGSFEDLFCFSEEIVARAVYRSKLPVISAVGHEIDTSISDFAADLRAPTPSAAAEIIIAKKDELTYRVVNCSNRLKQISDYYIAEQRRHIDYCAKVVGQPKRRLDDLTLRIDDLTSHLVTLYKSNINAGRVRINLSEEGLKRVSSRVVSFKREKRFDMLKQKLKNLLMEKMKYNDYLLNELAKRLDFANPYNLLKKGYSITTLKNTKKIIKSAKDVKAGTLLDVKLKEGSIDCKVINVYEN
jgi:exodeoxyribonuclease VII large subunit